MKFRDVKKGESYYILFENYRTDSIGVIIKAKILRKHTRYSDETYTIEQNINGYIHKTKISDYLMAEKLFFNVDEIRNIEFNYRQREKQSRYYSINMRTYKCCEAKDKVSKAYEKLNAKQKTAVMLEIKKHAPQWIKQGGWLKVSKLKLTNWIDVGWLIAGIKFPLRAF